MKLFDELFRDKIEKYNKEFLDKWKSLDLYKQYIEVENEFLYSYKNLGKNSGRNFYWFFTLIVLPLSFICLIFPFFFALKKHKQLKQKKDVEHEKHKKIEDSKFDLSVKIISSYLFDEHFEKMYSLLNFEKGGILDQNFLKLIDAEVLDLDSNINKNPWASSWDIYKKNKIILSWSAAKFEMTEQTYTGSVTVKIGDSYGTIYASYSHPKPIVWTENKKYLYIQECDNLSFNFDKSHYQSLFKNKNKTRLENEEFNKNTSWEINDEIQFRMIFTPLMQERFVREVKENKKERNVYVGPEDKYFKKDKVLSNEYVLENKYDLYLNIKNLFISFISDPKNNLTDLLKNYSSFVETYIYKNFLECKFLYMIPLVESLNNKTLINQALKIKREYNDSYIFYALSNIIKKDIHKIDTQPFYNVLTSKIINGVYTSFVNVLSHKIIKKTIYIWKDGVDVPVVYDDYIKNDKDIKICYKFINNKELFYRPFVLGHYVEMTKLKNNDSIEKFIMNFDQKNNCETYIKDGLLVCLLTDIDQDQNNIINYMNELVDKLEK